MDQSCSIFFKGVNPLPQDESNLLFNDLLLSIPENYQQIEEKMNKTQKYQNKIRQYSSEVQRILARHSQVKKINQKKFLELFNFDRQTFRSHNYPKVSPDQLMKTIQTQVIVKLIQYCSLQEISRQKTTTINLFINYLKEKKKERQKILDQIMNKDKEEIFQQIFRKQRHLIARSDNEECQKVVLYIYKAQILFEKIKKTFLEEQQKENYFSNQNEKKEEINEKEYSMEEQLIPYDGSSKQIQDQSFSVMEELWNWK